MTQNPQSNSSSILKATSANVSTTSTDQPARRSRSGSLMRAMTHHSTNSNSPSKNQHLPPLSVSRRSMSASEDQNARRPSTNTTDTPVTDYPFHFDQAPDLSVHSLVQISESNWAKKIEDFDIRSPIGYGSSAIVYEALYKPLNKRVAIKMIDLDQFERNQIDELRRETSVMVLSKHPNVLRVYGSFVDGSKLCIVTPYLWAGSCHDIIKTYFPDGFDEPSIAIILKQALEGLLYLHKNGHIHRDVKAGNLLMDDQGTVLLADFGVSSSLSESTDVRRTFVGTPCWMAPEVMEQAGYDFKADIWSFGITALELATGHAPFAKYPPMKVLMMTLSNDPPTLDRENAKHKFSKNFKDMIDACMQKDPSKRPSAEKLLQYHFFKQTKRKEYLIKSVLSSVKPLNERPHKKVPQQHVAADTCEQWDFDTQSDSKCGSPPASATGTATPPPLPTAADATAEQSGDLTVPMPKKHISFGDVVIKDPSVRIQMSPVAESPTSTTPTSTPATSPALAKKSRFVIEDSESQSSSQHHSPQHPLQSPVAPLHLTAEPTALTGVGLGISANSQPLQDAGEVKKGRFSVNQTPQSRPSTPADGCDTPDKSIQNQRQSTDEKPVPIYRAASHDNLPDSRSRFGLMMTEAGALSTPAESVASSIMSLSRDSSVNGKISRFSVEKNEAVGPFCDFISASPECRKKGRFELTGGSATLNGEQALKHDAVHHLESPQSSRSGSPSVSPCTSLSRGQSRRIVDPNLPQTVYSHMEALLRQTEQQRLLLHDMLCNMPATYSAHPAAAARSKTTPDAKKAIHDPPLTVDTSKQSLNMEIASTIDNLQHLLLSSTQERERLSQENRELRREIEQLRKPNVVASGAATSDPVKENSTPDVRRQSMADDASSTKNETSNVHKTPSTTAN